VTGFDWSMTDNELRMIMIMITMITLQTMYTSWTPPKLSKRWQKPRFSSSSWWVGRWWRSV